MLLISNIPVVILPQKKTRVIDSKDGPNRHGITVIVSTMHKVFQQGLHVKKR